MKKLLLIAALASLSTPAFASKARLNALANADHLVDVQTAFNNPAHLTVLSDYATFETGPTAIPTYSATAGTLPSNTASAEGGFVKSSGNSKWGAYLGRKSDFTSLVRAQGGFKAQENTIELQYAMKGAISWGASLNYSNSDTKSTTPARKQNAYGARFGATADVWEAYAVLGLGSEAKGNAAGGTLGLAADADSKLKGTLGFKLGGNYKMDNLHLYAKYYQDGAELDTTVTTAANGLKLAQSQLDLGVIDHQKMDGGQWFYGVALQQFQSKRDGATAAYDSKTTATYMPFLLGMEYDAASWMTLRASATQNVLIGSTKTEVTAGGETDTIPNNTTVGAGIALKLNKWTVDGSWAAGTTGDVNTTNILTNAALTYNF